jgi:hypothetical protein
MAFSRLISFAGAAPYFDRAVLNDGDAGGVT